MHWVTILLQFKQHNFPFKVHLSNHLICVVFGLNRGYPPSVNMKDRGVEACKAIVDAGMLTWADIDCSPPPPPPPPLVAGCPNISYTVPPNGAGAGQWSPNTKLLIRNLDDTWCNKHDVDTFAFREWRDKVISKVNVKIKILTNNTSVKDYKNVLQQKEPLLWTIFIMGLLLPQQINLIECWIYLSTILCSSPYK